MQVVIVGTTHHNTLSLVRALGHEGVPIDVILHDGAHDSYILKSKYISKYYISASVDAAVAILASSYESAIVISCSDSFSAAFDALDASVKDHFFYFHSISCSNIGVLMDKHKQGTIAQSLGLEVPESIVYHLGDPIPANLPYPCLLKPNASINGGKKIVIANDSADLSNKLSLFHHCDSIIIQEFINKDFEIVIPGLSVNGVQHHPGCIRKYRDISGGTTYSTVLDIDVVPNEVVTSIDRLIAEIGYEGLYGVELLVCRNHYFFIEINLRNDATTYSICEAGCNLPYIYCLAKQGLPYDKYLTRVHHIDSMVELADFSFVLKLKLNAFKWARQRRLCKCRYYQDRNDPKPYAAAKKSYVKRILKKI